MAGVTNTVFRSICRDHGADILTTEFVSAEGIFHRNQRTREYLEFSPPERPLGVQLFGGNPEHLAEAAKHVVDWVNPDFIDLNFGCPVNKVVCKQGGSALLKDCPLLERVADAVVRAVAPLPVTAKIRIGWDEKTINATHTAKILEGCGIRRLAVHGRTKAQGYSGEADWNVIAEVAATVKMPVVGNGDITCAQTARRRLRESGVAGLMIGRAAMSNPWIFQEIRTLLETGVEAIPATLDQRWSLILDHCRREITWRKDENFALRAMRSRLMAYTRGMPGGRHLRGALAQIASLGQLEGLVGDHLAQMEAGVLEGMSGAFTPNV